MCLNANINTKISFSVNKGNKCLNYLVTLWASKVMKMFTFCSDDQTVFRCFFLVALIHQLQLQSHWLLLKAATKHSLLFFFLNFCDQLENFPHGNLLTSPLTAEKLKAKHYEQRLNPYYRCVNRGV